MTVTPRSILSVVGPGIVWAVHFVAIYALISAACAPRHLLDHGAVLMAGGAATALSLALCLLPVAVPPRSAPHDLIRAAFWSGLIFAVAVLANAGALLFFQGCGG